MPEGLQEILSGLDRLADLHPEHSEGSSGLTEIPAQNTRDVVLDTGCLRHVQEYTANLPLADAEGLPIPPLHRPPVVGQPSEPAFEGVCYAVSPGYQAEVLRLTLRPPIDLATFNNAVREALHHLRLPYCFITAPTVPQLGPDFASIVIAPKWLPQAGRQVVVFDFRAFGGPVYAHYVHDTVSYWECAREAARHGYDDCVVYVQGCSRALSAGDTFLAALGGVIQFQPPGTQAQWCGTLAARFNRPQWWLAHPQLPPFGTERPVLVLHHESSTLYSAARFPDVPTLRLLASLVDRPPERVLYVSPPGNGLSNVEFHGTPCRDALAIFPLTPHTEREGILVFLDPRQAGVEVTHIYLPSTAANPHELVRFLRLQPPPCYRVAVSPRPDRDRSTSLSGR